MAESRAARNRLRTTGGSRSATTADVEFRTSGGSTAPSDPITRTCSIQGTTLTGPRRESFLPPPLCQELADFIQLLRREFLIFDQLDQQRLRGSVEDALQEVVHHIADDFALRLSGRVD